MKSQRRHSRGNSAPVLCRKAERLKFSMMRSRDSVRGTTKTRMTRRGWYREMDGEGEVYGVDELRVIHDVCLPPKVLANL